MLISKLIDSRYLDSELRTVYVDRLNKAKDKEQERDLLLQTTKLLVRELNLIPDKLILEYLLKDANTINDIKKKISVVKSKKEIFDRIKTTDELISLLSKEDNAYLYYLIYGGKYR